MELLLKNLEGKDIEKINFLENTFLDEDINLPLIHECVVNYLNNQRQGTSSTKTVAEVSGGGKKPWKQKGTGRARVGSNRSPLWRHGGISFGPKPRDYYSAMPHKKKIKGLLFSFLLKGKDSQIIPIDTFFNSNIQKTKQACLIFNALNIQGKSLIVLNKKDDNFVRAVRNLKNIKIVYVNNINIYDVMSSDSIIIDKCSVDFLNQKFTVGEN